MRENFALGIEKSLAGQAWHWRGGAGGSADAPDDLVSRILLSRGADAARLADWARPSLRAFMPDPAIFLDMEKGAARLADAISAREHIVIFGDYDVDGATSAALLIRLIRALGHDAQAYIPDRLLEGYGPSAAALLGMQADGATLVVTVDCGAQAFEALGAAADAALDVMVVDHHQCTTSLPRALAMINPNRLDGSDAERAEGHLAAVGVAFLLGAALVRNLRARGWFADGTGRTEPDLMALLDIVALGTVADVARLTGLNRAFVAQGLRVMARRGNIGLAALADVAKLARAPEARDLGFALGPRINAGGRVGAADLGVRLLTSDDPLEVRDIAEELSRLNDERRAIEAQVTDEALAAAENTVNMAVSVVAAPGWHPGVIGIVASRVKERLHRPAIVVALGDDGVGKGSGRSIAGVDLGAAVIAARDAGLLVAGGGHAMAAGVTIAPGGLARFAEWMNERLAADVARASGERALKLDALLAPRGVNLDFLAAVEQGGPYGHGWSAPRVAVGPVRIIKAVVVGNGHVRMVAAGEDGARVTAVAFRAAENALGQALLAQRGDARLYLAGQIRRNDWNGRQSAEMHVDDAALVT